MCGIFGYIGVNELKIGKNILPHRGPDDWGMIICEFGKKYITFFQSRLSIIGLGKQGHQPFQKYSGKVLVYNGEIYNYLDIRKQLLNDYGISFITDTDTEVIYESIINLGIRKTLEVINGMFAFAYYDYTSEDIFIARDNLGIKPLYYSNQESNFVFSSEAKSFFEVLKLSDCFIRNTTTDGDSISIREALYLGIHVIATNCVDRPEGVEIIALGDILSLENAINKIIENQSFSKPIQIPNNGGIDLVNLYKKKLLELEDY